MLLILCGLPGVGKTTIAKGAHFPYIDLDDLMERRCRMSCKEIWSYGEAYFRMQEGLALDAVDLQEGILALGGGTLSREAHVAKVKKMGSLLYLHASVETLKKRRPEHPPYDRQKRIATFLEHCDHQIDTDALSFEEVIWQVTRLAHSFALRPGESLMEKG